MIRSIILLCALAATSTSALSQSHRRAFLQKAAIASTAMIAGSLTSNAVEIGGKPHFGDDSIMSQKAHGTSDKPAQSDLLYGVSSQAADKICNFNRRFAEYAGYFESTPFEDIVLSSTGPVTFFDSVTGKPLFVAPIGRSAEQFIAESRTHGWPSFRDSEVVWENVRVLKSSGETVSVDGTHLGHNLPDRSGNRYCINLVSVAGKPANSA